MLKAEYQQRGPNPTEFIDAIEFTLPDPGEGEVLIEVLASPINPSDVLTLTGLYGMLPDLPAIGGNEGVGRVVQQGAGVESPAVGQMVLLPVGSGTWVTHQLAKAATLVPLPNQADPVQMSMMTVNPPTASLMLSEFVELSEGDWVIQNAANSGVGAYLNQLAKARGINVINVVRRESATDDVERSGGSNVLVDDYDLGNRVLALTNGEPVKLGIDAVGGKATDHIADSVSPGGTVVNYGMMSGQPCQLSPRSFVFRDITLKGFWLAFWFRNATPEAQQALYGDLAARIARGELHAPVHATYDVSDIKAAVAAAAAGERDGKILITPKHS